MSTEQRKKMGKSIQENGSGAIFPIAENRKDMPSGYEHFIQEIIRELNSEK